MNRASRLLGALLLATTVPVLAAEPTLEAFVGPDAFTDIRISPDGRQFTLSLAKDEQHPAKLWRLNADGTNARAVPIDWPDTVKIFGGQWTPDGRHFLFLSDHAGLTNAYELVSPPWYDHAAAWLATRLPNGVHRRLEGADHGAPLDEPDAVADLIRLAAAG